MVTVTASVFVHPLLSVTVTVYVVVAVDLHWCLLYLHHCSMRMCILVYHHYPLLSMLCQAITDFIRPPASTLGKWIYCYHNCIGLRTPFAVCNSHCICCCHRWTNTCGCCCCPACSTNMYKLVFSTSNCCECCTKAITDFYICPASTS